MTSPLLRPSACRLIGLGLLTAWPALVGAQTAPETAPPSPAVFGGARRTQPGVNNVTFSSSVLGGYDTNVFAGGGAGVGGGGGVGVGSTAGSESSFAATNAQLQWSQPRERTSFFGNIGGQYRRMLDIDDFDVQAYSAGAGMSARLTTRSSLSLSGRVSAQPFYQWSLLGGLGDDLAADPTEPGESFSPDFLAAREQALRYGAGASYTYRLSSRTTFAASVQRSGFRTLNDEARESGLRNLGSTSARARITRRLTEHLGVRAGYGYVQFDRVRRPSFLPVQPDPELALDEDVIPPAGPREEKYGVHIIDAGLDYSRAFQFARRTTFSFGTGSNVSQRQSATGDDSSRRTRVNITGSATLRREFLRTWGASLQYVRGTSYAEGLNEFVVYDAASASVGGQFTDRLDGRASVSWSTGRFNTLGQERLWFVNAGAQLRYGFSPNIAAFVAGTYARRELPDEYLVVAEARGFRPDRMGVRAGLTFWFDLLR